MSHVIELASDFGELKVWLATVIISKPLSEDLLNKLRTTVAGCRDSLIAVVPASRVLNSWHMIYPSYLSLRDHLRGISRFKDPGLGAITYMAGSTQLRKGLAIMNPVGYDKLSLIVMGINDCVINSIGAILNSLKDVLIDLVIGVGVFRFYDGVFRSVDEFMESLISRYVSEFT
ncbi:MAG: hypothetical protein ACP5GY_02645 [Vulcanisaeta sp.]